MQAPETAFDHTAIGRRPANGVSCPTPAAKAKPKDFNLEDSFWGPGNCERTARCSLPLHIRKFRPDTRCRLRKSCSSFFQSGRSARRTPAANRGSESAEIAVDSPSRLIDAPTEVQVGQMIGITSSPGMSGEILPHCRLPMRLSSTGRDGGRAPPCLECAERSAPASARSC